MPVQYIVPRYEWIIKIEAEISHGKMQRVNSQLEDSVLKLFLNRSPCINEAYLQ